MRWNAGFDFSMNARITVNGLEVAATDADDRYGWADIDFIRAPGNFSAVRIRVYGDVKIEPRPRPSGELTDAVWRQLYDDQTKLLATASRIAAVNAHDDPEDYLFCGHKVHNPDKETVERAAAISRYLEEVGKARVSGE